MIFYALMKEYWKEVFLISISDKELSISRETETIKEVVDGSLLQKGVGCKKTKKFRNWFYRNNFYWTRIILKKMMHTIYLHTLKSRLELFRSYFSNILSQVVNRYEKTLTAEDLNIDLSVSKGENNNHFLNWKIQKAQIGAF